MLSGIFTHVKNGSAYKDENPAAGGRIPRNAREPGETLAYNLVQTFWILDVLSLLPKAIVATARLREGELRSLELLDYAGGEVTVRRGRQWRTNRRLVAAGSRCRSLRR